MKNFTLTIMTMMTMLALTIGLSVTSLAQNLETRRWIDRFGTINKETTERYKEATGATIQVDVDYGTFGNDVEAYGHLETQGHKEVEAALRYVCIDQTSKDAVKLGLKKVIFKNVTDPKQIGATLTGGVLVVKGQWNQGLDGRVRENDLAKLLEKNL